MEDGEGRNRKTEVRCGVQDTGCQILDEASQKTKASTSSHNLADLFKQNKLFSLCE